MLLPGSDVEHKIPTITAEEATLTIKPEVSKLPESAETNQVSTNPPNTLKSVKKNFVEPEVSAPVDVLEATTFFQGITTSGSTI